MFDYEFDISEACLHRIRPEFNRRIPKNQKIVEGIAKFWSLFHNEITPQNNVIKKFNDINKMNNVQTIFKNRACDFYINVWLRFWHQWNKPASFQT